MTQPEKQTVLVLGAYGLIGVDVTRALEAAGFKVTGLGRNIQTANRVLPNRTWVIADISTLTKPDDWRDALSGVDHVVNCSGALQNNADTDLEALHHHAIKALATACAHRAVGLVQISAVGANVDAGTEFMASKARGDAAIRNAMTNFTIIKPGLVLSHTGYGGTQLLRMLSATPWIQPVAFGKTAIQTVSIHDVTASVVRAVQGGYPPETEFDLVEPEPHSLKQIILAIREWLGFAPPKFTLPFPKSLAWGISKCADGLGRLGWRSPLRATAMQVLKTGVVGEHDPNALPHTKTLSQTLASMPATSEDRLSARMALLMPLILGVLCIFWLASGVIGMLRFTQAASVLGDAGWPNALAIASVIFWAVVDIVLGLAVLVRRYAPHACLAMIAVSLIYLVSATLFVPHLWIDPLGPLVKVLPSIALALVARVLLEQR